MGGEVSRTQLFQRLNDPIDREAAVRFAAYLARRLDHEPSAYITGRREFYGLDFEVTPAVLIPRPETETLVEAAIELAGNFSPLSPSPRAERGRTNPGQTSIADIGTGSGCVAIALASALPDATICALDASPAALEVAKRNASRHGVEKRIVFKESQLLAGLEAPVDLIVANLPYVKTADLAALPPEIRDHEPRLALDGGPDGLDVIRALLAQAPSHVRRGGAVCLEFGDDQEAALIALAARAFVHGRVLTRPDLGGRPRVLVIETPPS